MKNTIKQMAVTPQELTHGGIGLGAVINGMWLDYLNPIVQMIVSIGGLVYLFWMIRNKRMEWKLKQQEFCDNQRRIEREKQP